MGPTNKGAEGFGPRLAGLRRAAGLTQQQLAGRLCVTRQAVSRWESGRTQPDLAGLQELAAALGCTLEQLVGGLEPAAGPDEGLRRTCRRVFWCKALLAAVQIGLWLWLRKPAGVWLPAILLLCDGSVYLPLEAMVRSGDFTLLAGFDRRLHYHRPTLMRMVQMIDLTVQLNGLAWVLVGFLLCLPMPASVRQWGFPVLVVGYILGMLTGIVLVNVKYGASLLPDREEQRRSRAAVPVLAVWGVLFCLQLGLCIGLAVGYRIPNNTPGALVQMGWGTPGMLLGFGLLFWEMRRADTAARAGANWRPGRAFWLLLAGCVFCAMMQWGAAAAYAGGGVLR